MDGFSEHVCGGFGVCASEVKRNRLVSANREPRGAALHSCARGAALRVRGARGDGRVAWQAGQ